MNIQIKCQTTRKKRWLILDLGSVLSDLRALFKISAKLLFTRKAVAELLSTNEGTMMLISKLNKDNTSCWDYVTMLVFGSNVMMEPRA